MPVITAHAPGLPFQGIETFDSSDYRYSDAVEVFVRTTGTEKLAPTSFNTPRFFADTNAGRTDFRQPAAWPKGWFGGSRGTWMDAGAIVLAIALTAALHYFSAKVHPVWFGVVEHLYAVPIGWAALRGGIAAGAFAGLASALAVVCVITFGELPSDITSLTIAETPAFLVIGVVGGLLATRWRRRTLQVATLKADLQDRSEQLTRSGKLSAAGELALGLAHELRHPIASVKGIVSLLRDTDSSAAVREECVTILDRECERMERLLSELLAFARPREPEVAAVSGHDIVDAAFSLVKYVGGAAHVTFRKDIAANVATLYCDRDLIRQVLVNLLLNSVHAMPAGGTVLVRVTAQKSTAILEVIDEGHGVAPELMDKIFLPFVTTRSEGTGLGLSIARQIVAQHGGELTAERNMHRGMTFRFDLPLEEMSCS